MANFVSVNSIDEENKRFRVIMTKAVAPTEFGSYSITIPYPTDLTNSRKFKQCLMKLETITIGLMNDSANAGVIANPNPVWCEPAPGGVGALVREGLDAVILNMGLPSKNTLRSHKGDATPTVDNLYRYQELIPLHLKFRGNYQGLEPSPGGGGVVAGGNSYAYSFSPPNESGIITAIPFGREINYYLSSPFTSDPARVYLADIGAAGLPDLTRISMSWTIELLD